MRATRPRGLVAGVDSSTQSCTVVLRRLDDGGLVAEARAPHPPTAPPISEQPPEAWWNALLECVSALGDHAAEVAAVSVGGQGHGLVMLDAAGAALRPAKLWNDTESASDAARLRGALPPVAWARRTGSVPGPALTVSKLAWTERVHPGLLSRAAYVMLPSDYLGYRLCGVAATERGGASGTGYFDPSRNAWDMDLARIAAPEIDAAVLPRLAGSSESVGVATALFAGAVVGPGSNDNLMAALGMGLEAGDTVMSIGTSGTVYGVSEAAVHDGSGAINGYADATERFMPMVTTLNAAKVTDSFRRLLDVTPDAFDALALGAPAGAHGLILIPYLDGERTPDLPLARGEIQGLRTSVTRSDVARAAVEGVLCGLLEGRDRLRAAGVAMGGRQILTGGGARSESYRQILADLTGEPVWICDLAEAAAAGAAVQAAAVLRGISAREQAALWRPAWRRAAEPRAVDAASVRGAYRRAADRLTT